MILFNTRLKEEFSRKTRKIVTLLYPKLENYIIC